MNKTYPVPKETYEAPLLRDIAPVTVQGEGEHEPGVSNWETSNGTGDGD